MLKIFISFFTLISLMVNMSFSLSFKEEIKAPISIPPIFSRLTFCEDSLYVINKAPCSCNVPVNIYKYKSYKGKFIFEKIETLKYYLSENQWLNPISIKVREEKLYILCNSFDFIDKEQGTIFNSNVLYIYDAKSLEYLREIELKNSEVVDFEVLNSSEDIGIVYTPSNTVSSKFLIVDRDGKVKKDLNLSILRGRCQSFSENLIALAGVKPLTPAFSREGSYGVYLYSIANQKLIEIEALKRELIYDFFILNSNEIFYTTPLESSADSNKVALKLFDIKEEKIKEILDLENIPGEALCYDEQTSSIYLYDESDSMPLRVIKENRVDETPILTQFEIQRDSYLFQPFLMTCTNSSEIIIAESDGYLKKFNTSTKGMTTQVYDRKLIMPFKLRDIESMNGKIYLLFEEEIKIVEEGKYISTINISTIDSPRNILFGKNILFVETSDKFLFVINLENKLLERKYQINFDYRLIASYDGELWALLPDWYIGKIAFNDDNNKAFVKEKIKLFKGLSEERIKMLTYDEPSPNFMDINSRGLIIISNNINNFNIFCFDWLGENILIHKKTAALPTYSELIDFSYKNNTLYAIDKYRGRILSCTLFME